MASAFVDNRLHLPVWCRLYSTSVGTRSGANSRIARLRATTIAGPEGLLPQVRGMRVASDYGRVPIAFVHIQVPLGSAAAWVEPTCHATCGVRPWGNRSEPLITTQVVMSDHRPCHRSCFLGKL